MIKDMDEIAVMKKAGQITDAVYGEVLGFLKEGVTEYDVSYEIDHQFAKRGVEYPSFATGVRRARALLVYLFFRLSSPNLLVDP
jgi:Xaa-Pro aminopeptidase